MSKWEVVIKNGVRILIRSKIDRCICNHVKSNHKGSKKNGDRFCYWCSCQKFVDMNIKKGTNHRND